MLNTKITILAICLLLTLSANAQSLKVINADSDFSGMVGTEIRTALRLQNISTEPIFVNVLQVDEQIGSSQKSFYCIDNDCTKENIVQQNFIREIFPGETIEFLTTVLETGLVQSISSVKYRFYDVNNPEDNIDFELNYAIAERKKEGVLYSSKDLELSDVYPNPVSKTAIFDYLIKDNSKEAKIVIHNVLGSVAGEYILSPYESKLSIEVDPFNPGVYFYTLYLDNEGVATKKLVVRK